MKTLTLLITLLVASFNSLMATPVASPSSFDICMGGTPSITVSGCHHYTSTPSIPGLIYVVNSGTLTIYVSSSTTFTITGYNADNSSCGSISVPVNYSTPTAFSLSPSSPSLCPGQSTTISASEPSLSYTWTPAAGLSATTGASVVASPTVTTNYTVHGVNAQGCTNTAYMTINVGDLPVATMVSGTSGTSCAGVAKVITVRKTGAGGLIVTPSNYSQINDSTYAFAPTTSTTYSFTPIGSTGCVGPVSTYALTVNNPAAGSIASSQGLTLCGGASTTLTTSYNSNYTYNWVASPSLTVVGGNVAMATPTATTTYTCNVTNGVCTVAKTITINVSGTAPSLSLNTYAVTTCASGSVSLSASAASGSNITWSPAFGLDVTTGNNVIANPSGNVVYTVTATNGGCSNTKMVAVAVISDVDLTVPVANINLCPGQKVLSDLNLITSNNAISYSWSHAATVESQTPNNGTVYLAPTTNTVYTVTASNGSCSATATISINIVALPNVSIAQSAVDVTLGNSYTASITSDATTFLWEPSIGIANTNIANAVFTPTVSNVYTLTVYEGVGQCASTATLSINVLPLRAGSMVDATDASVENAYPNPANNMINVKMTNIVNGTAYLMDMNGRTVEAKNMVASDIINFDLANLDNGTYIVKVINENNVSSNIKFVKTSN
jgi:hypothetical protein